MKKCELCSSQANMYCESDQASLCWRCDAKVHSANFLVAKHSRTLLCNVCQVLTPWTASGEKLGPTVFVCSSCVDHRQKVNSRGSDGGKEEIDGGNDADVDEDEESGSSDEDDEEEDETLGDEEDDQVVPLTSSASCTTPPPPVSGCSSSENEDSSSSSSSSSASSIRTSSTLAAVTAKSTDLCLKRKRDNADLCSDHQSNCRKISTTAAARLPSQPVSTILRLGGP